jgi:hypothetical protein
MTQRESERQKEEEERDHATLQRDLDVTSREDARQMRQGAEEDDDKHRHLNKDWEQQVKEGGGSGM